MNVKYSNKVVVKKAFEIPVGEFQYQMSPIKFSVGNVLWKYNGKYNKKCPALVKGGLEWAASWCESGYVIPMEYLEIVSERNDTMNEDRMKKYELVEMLLDVSSWMTCCEYDESKPIDEIIQQISDTISERIADRLRDMDELPPK